MSHVLVDPFQAEYFRLAFVEAVLLGVFGGVLGVYVVLRRLAFLGDALTHTVFPGVAIAFALDLSLYLGAFVAGVVSAVLLTVLTRNKRVSDDSALAVLLTGFFAVGVLVVSRSRSFSADLTSLLFGRILDVGVGDLIVTALTMIVVLGVLAGVHKELIFRTFDEEGARSLGLPVGALDLVLNIGITLFVVAGVRAVGTVLVVALLVTPAATAQVFGRSVRSMMVIGVVVGVLGAWIGTTVSYVASVDHGVRLGTGAMIVLAITVIFLLALPIGSLRRRRTTAPFVAAGVES